MNKPMELSAMAAVDGLQQRITGYACALTYDRLTPQAAHDIRARVIDTLGTLVGGYFGEPCRIARNLAARLPHPQGATVIGTRLKTTPDMAAFVNATAARYLDMNDGYLWPGSYMGHPSDVLTPILAVAEHVHASGREFITAVALGYEVFLRMCDAFRNQAFDSSIFGCLGSAVGAAKVLRLTPQQTAHCISMAIVPNNTLKQVRTGHLSMFKAAAAGQGGRAGVFAALLAQAGMEGPHLPFEGKAGWLDHVARDRFTLDTWGGGGTPFKVEDTLIKLRPACGRTISSILAAEKIGAVNVKNIERVVVEVYNAAKEGKGTGEHHWNPDSRETADHSIPYVVAASLMDGTITPRQFDDAHLWNPELRALMQRIEVVENADFTRAYERVPQEHHTRITVAMKSGESVIGATAADSDSMAGRKTDEQIEAKFVSLTEEVLGAHRVKRLLATLWQLEDMDDVAEIPSAFAFA
jgi:2-methylcitrate dehydratase